MDAALLSGGLALLRPGHRRDGPGLYGALALLQRAMEESPFVPPPTVVVDLDEALRSTRRGGGEIGADQSALGQALQRYDDRVLGRLLSEPGLARASDAVTRLPDELRSTALAILCARMAQRFEYRVDTGFGVGTARALEKMSEAELTAAGADALRHPEVCDRLRTAFEQWVRGAARCRRLLTDADIQLLECLPVQSTRARRLALAQVSEAEAALEEGLPRRIVPRRRRHRGPTPTAMEDESRYPIGGFAAIANSGAMENLLTSELVYMSPPEADEAVDLFALRWAQGELLFYTRDEAQLVRQRHALAVWLPAALRDARVKDPQLRWQRLVMVLAQLSCIVRRLCEGLREEALSIRLCFPPPEAGLREAQELCALMLRPWLVAGVVEIAEAAASDDLAWSADAALRGRSDLLWYGDGAPEATGVEVLSFGVDAPRDLAAWQQESFALLARLL